MPKISRSLSNLYYPPIEIALAGVGQFDRRGQPNAVWAGVHPHDALAGLHKKVDQALVRCGLAPERRAYLPHITLARMGAAAGPTDRFLESHAGLASPLFALDHYQLFESTLGSDGATYEAIERYPLRA